jgi:hypothetical protein
MEGETARQAVALACALFAAHRDSETIFDNLTVGLAGTANPIKTSLSDLLKRQRKRERLSARASPLPRRWESGNRSRCAMRSLQQITKPCANDTFRAACGLAIIRHVVVSACNAFTPSSNQTNRPRFHPPVCKSLKHTFQFSRADIAKPSRISHQSRVVVESMCISKI